MTYYLYGENMVTEVKLLEQYGRWQRSLCTEMDIHRTPIRAYILVEYVEPNRPLVSVPLYESWQFGFKES